MIMIDKLAYLSSIRFESPYLKSCFAISSLIICASSSSVIISFVIMFIMGGFAVYNSKASFLYYMKLMLIPGVFLIFSTITIVINISPKPLDLFAFPVGSYYITGSMASLIKALSLMVKAFGSVSCLYFLILTTPMIDILEVLRKLHVPSVVIELAMLMYRFIFVLLEMGTAILTSQACRLGHRSMKSSIKAMGNMLAVLLIRAYKKSDAIYNAMEARCYDGTLNVVTNLRKAKRKHIILVIVIELFLLSLALGCNYYGI